MLAGSCFGKIHGNIVFAKIFTVIGIRIKLYTKLYKSLPHFLSKKKNGQIICGQIDELMCWRCVGLKSQTKA